MRYWIALVAASLSLAPGAVNARYHHAYHHSYHHAYSSSTSYYTARSGHRVHGPIQAAHAPQGASARCGDGSWSFSESHRGTCSHHGGVSRWL